ncbi:hypothetical protein [Curtobacterium sp. MMLR14_010]|uniref:hypothetical protein n=1 Tax=Curtobacterium sp. MMLR14_010 TaxID=1898743 RepID=UPI0011134A67|nr:hypothetical protein [Curtobacterium sp. MMLR14_010]
MSATVHDAEVADPAFGLHTGCGERGDRVHCVAGLCCPTEDREAVGVTGTADGGVIAAPPVLSDERVAAVFWKRTDRFAGLGGRADRQVGGWICARFRGRCWHDQGAGSDGCDQE